MFSHVKLGTPKFDLGHRDFFFWGRNCSRGAQPEQGSSSVKVPACSKGVLMVEKGLKWWSIRSVEPPTNFESWQLTDLCCMRRMKLHSGHGRSTNTNRRKVCSSGSRQVDSNRAAADAHVVHSASLEELHVCLLHWKGLSGMSGSYRFSSCVQQTTEH